MYSASQEDNATTSCFFDHQLIGAPRNLKRYPVVLFLSTLSPHQSEYEKLINIVVDSKIPTRPMRAV